MTMVIAGWTINREVKSSTSPIGQKFVLTFLINLRPNRTGLW